MKGTMKQRKLVKGGDGGELVTITRMYGGRMLKGPGLKSSGLYKRHAHPSMLCVLLFGIIRSGLLQERNENRVYISEPSFAFFSTLTIKREKKQKHKI